MSRSNDKVIGITLGDPTGIGPEVVAKALNKPSVRAQARFLLIGDRRAYEQYSARLYKNCSFLECPLNIPQRFRPGKPSPDSSAAAIAYLNKAIELLKDKKIAALVTGPLSKEGICRLGYDFKGHTEYLADAFKVKHCGMMFVSPTLRTIIVTRHIPLKTVSHAITTAKVYQTIVLLAEALRVHFRIKNPKIAVCGLNPHAGEGGKIGTEEIDIIGPAIEKARKNSIRTQGPLSADTLFSPKVSRDYDAVVAMYHDQGLIPVKTMHFDSVVNFTVGLPFIRTCPAHGTAYNIAGTNKADPSSMSEAIRLAVRLSS